MLESIDVYTQSIPVFTGINTIAAYSFCRSKPGVTREGRLHGGRRPAMCSSHSGYSDLYFTALGHYRSVSEHMRLPAARRLNIPESTPTARHHSLQRYVCNLATRSLAEDALNRAICTLPILHAIAICSHLIRCQNAASINASASTKKVRPTLGQRGFHPAPSNTTGL
jgi:hypothetical protein